MRVTRDSLVRIAKETVQERAFNNPDILAAYLTGSLLTEEPMLGGTADIDIVFVHKNNPKKREFVKLTPDFHLDLSSRSKDEFKSPRELRGDPWLGFEMYAPMLLYEREKFFDFVQASLRAGFDFEQPPLMLQRCRKLLAHARQIWMDISEVEEPGPVEVKNYMRSLYHVINAVAEISGPPIQERRLLLEFPARAESAGRPGLSVGALGLVGGNKVDAAKITAWLGDWKGAFKAASESPNVDARIHVARINYYEKAIKSMLEGETPQAALWPLLSTWTLSVEALNEDHLNFWRVALKELGLAGTDFQEKVQGLDQYIDEVEVLLDETAAANGVDNS